jgi:hypothetical protein
MIKPVECELLKINQTYICFRHIGLAKHEVTLGIAQELSGFADSSKSPGSLRHLFNVTAENTWLLCVDRHGSSLGSINQTF